MQHTLYPPLSSAPFLLTAGVSLMCCMIACGDDGDSGSRPRNMTNATNMTTMTNIKGCLSSTDINGGKTLEEGEYCVRNSLELTNGVLELKPGVVLKFDADQGLRVGGGGRLKALGTMEKPVVFSGTMATRGHWKGINFSGSKSADNQLDHVMVEYAGSGGWSGSSSSKGGLYVNGTGNSLKIANSMFKENAYAAINIEDDGAEYDIESAAFDKNERPLIIPSNMAGRLKPDLTFTNNEKEFIWLNPGNAKTTVSTSQTWQAFSAPYRASNIIYVEAKLTLSPGAGMVFEQNIGLYVSGEGRLNAVGLPEAEIVFTGAEATRGFWRGIRFDNSKSADNVLEYAAVEYAGSDKWTGSNASRGGVFMYDDGTALRVTNSRFTENAYAGIQANESGTALTVTSTKFESNELPMWVAANVVKGLGEGLTFASNEKPYILVNSGTDSIDSKSLWLNHPVPYRVSSIINLLEELTIAPGTTIVFEQDTGLSVDGGTLIANAKGGDAISFLAADAGATGGYWAGIQFRKSFESANILANVDVKNAGGATGWNGSNTSIAAIYLYDTSMVKLDDVRIEGSERFGLSGTKGSKFEILPGGVTFSMLNGDGDATTNDEKYGEAFGM